MTLAAKRSQRKQAEAAPPVDASAADLLAWYDRNRRTLPWRATPGERADPYRVWLSEIMLQQTTVKAVAPYFARFTARWGDVRALAAASLDDVLRLWAGLGYYARARNLHACARAVVERHGGRFPESEAELAALPGIGAYTAAAVAAIAFGARSVPIDGNVERVVSRLFAVAEELPSAKAIIRKHADRLMPDDRAGDFAQALMDLGATICTPRKPACAFCPWMPACAARRQGVPESFPRKAPKREGRLRRGAAFVVTRADRQMLLRTRAPNGLLGGMSEVPTSDWTHDFDESAALAHAPILSPLSPLRTGQRENRTRREDGKTITWRRIPGVVRHVFTHFPLELVVYVAKVPAGAVASPDARWVPLAQLPGEALPNVMRKVIAHALSPRSLAGASVSEMKAQFL
jgi:A/G-specific adenine glycosylase